MTVVRCSVRREQGYFASPNLGEDSASMHRVRHLADRSHQTTVRLSPGIGAHRPVAERQGVLAEAISRSSGANLAIVPQPRCRMPGVTRRGGRGIAWGAGRHGKQRQLTATEFKHLGHSATRRGTVRWFYWYRFRVVRRANLAVGTSGATGYPARITRIIKGTRGAWSPR